MKAPGGRPLTRSLVFALAALGLIGGCLLQAEAYPQRSFRARPNIPSYYRPTHSSYMPSAATRGGFGRTVPPPTGYSGGGAAAPAYTVSGSVEMTLPYGGYEGRSSTQATGTFTGVALVSEARRQEIAAALRQLQDSVAEAHRHYARAIEAGDSATRSSELAAARSDEEEALRHLEDALLE